MLWKFEKHMRDVMIYMHNRAEIGIDFQTIALEVMEKFKLYYCFPVEPKDYINIIEALARQACFYVKKEWPDRSKDEFRTTATKSKP